MNHHWWWHFEGEQINLVRANLTATSMANTIEGQSVCTGRRYCIEKILHRKHVFKLSRRDFKNPKRVIFIAATDDEGWLKEAFAVEMEDFWADDIYFAADLFSSVGIRAPRAGEDLALLSLCNHSIISVSWHLLLNLTWLQQNLRFSPTPIHLAGEYIWTVGGTAGGRTGTIYIYAWKCFSFYCGFSCQN